MRALFVLLLLLVPLPARAHGLRARYVDVTIASATTAVVLLHGDGLGLATGAECSARGRSVVEVECAGGVAGATLGLTGLAADESAVVVVRLSRGDAEGAVVTTVVTAASPRIVIPGRVASAAVARRYAALGFEHVLRGSDHVLLLLALFWGAWRARRPFLELVRVATTFTIAHSISLAATTLGLVRLPTAPAEAAIALSLVLVALDVGRARASGALGLVALFGLVHGLGFAGALAEVGLPAGAVPTALLAFNAGVEVAQVTLLGICLLAATLAARVSRGRVLDLAEGLTAYAVGVAGTFLFLVRTSLFLR